MVHIDNLTNQIREHRCHLLPCTTFPRVPCCLLVKKHNLKLLITCIDYWFLIYWAQTTSLYFCLFYWNQQLWIWRSLNAITEPEPGSGSVYISVTPVSDQSSQSFQSSQSSSHPGRVRVDSPSSQVWFELIGSVTSVGSFITCPLTSQKPGQNLGPNGSTAGTLFSRAVERLKDQPADDSSWSFCSTVDPNTSILTQSEQDKL